jgi:Flp pilus assembly protein TadD
MRRSDRAFVLAAALALSACASAGGRPAQTEVVDANGFTITERVRAGSGARADFAQAVVLLEQEQLDAAIARLALVTAAAPQATLAHIDLGMAYSRVGDLAQAEASLKRALELNPRHPVAHNELGIVYRKTGRFAEARQSYETALALYPAFHFAHRNLGILCDLYLADVDCALEHYERYVAAAPGDETAVMWIADLRARTGR